MADRSAIERTDATSIRLPAATKSPQDAAAATQNAWQHSYKRWDSHATATGSG